FVAASIDTDHCFIDRCHINLRSVEYRQWEHRAHDVLPSVHDLADLQVHAQAGEHVRVLARERLYLRQVVEHRPPRGLGGEVEVRADARGGVEAAVVDPWRERAG